MGRFRDVQVLFEIAFSTFTATVTDIWRFDTVGANIWFEIRACPIAHTAETTVRIAAWSIAWKAETSLFAVKLILAVVVILSRNAIAFNSDMCPDLFGNRCGILINLSGDVNNPLLLIEHILNRSSVE